MRSDEMRLGDMNAPDELGVYEAQSLLVGEYGTIAAVSVCQSLTVNDDEPVAAAAAAAIAAACFNVIRR